MEKLLRFALIYAKGMLLGSYLVNGTYVRIGTYMRHCSLRSKIGKISDTVGYQQVRQLLPK